MSNFKCVRCQSSQCIKLINLDATQIISDLPIYQHFYSHFNFVICTHCGQMEGNFPLQDEPVSIADHSISEPVPILYQAMRSEMKASGHSF